MANERGSRSASAANTIPSRRLLGVLSTCYIVTCHHDYDKQNPRVLRWAVPKFLRCCCIRSHTRSFHLRGQVALFETSLLYGLCGWMGQALLGIQRLSLRFSNQVGVQSLTLRSPESMYPSCVSVTAGSIVPDNQSKYHPAAPRLSFTLLYIINK